MFLFEKLYLLSSFPSFFLSHFHDYNPTVVFASVLIPGGTINLVVRTAKFAMTWRTFHAMPVVVKNWFPTMSGLGSIPMIVHPIDSFVDLAMNHTTRKWITTESLK